MEPGETPLDNALRELHEETGLTGRSPRLSVVVSELDAERAEAWLMFVFRVDVEAGGRLRGGDEGEPAWFELDAVAELPTPPADAAILAAVRSDAPGVAFLNVRFGDGSLRSVTTTRAR